MKQVLFVFAILFSIAAFGADREVFSVGPEPTLDLSNVSGKVTVKAGDVGEIVVEYHVKDDRIDVIMDQDGDTVIVKVEYPRNTRNVRGGVTFDVIVPAEVNLDVSSVSGGISAEGMSGMLELSTVSGSLKVTDLGGTLYLKSVSGGIDAHNIEASNAQMTSVSGSIEFSGAINGGDYDFKSTSGSIRLQVGSDPSFRVTGNTLSGSIRDGLNAFEVRRPKYGPGARLRGSVGGGDGRVDISTVSGSISVKR